MPTVIPHPVFPSDPPRADDGRTLLCLGTIRPYKGLGDAIAATKRIDGAHLLVAGDPFEPVNGYRAEAGELAEWRLGYLPQGRLERALGEATVALFPYRPELDQSGALLQALGAGVPAVAYDVGGIAEPIRRFGAGRVVPAGDVDALAAAARELLDDPAALEEARAGARRARETLTWDAAAAATSTSTVSSYEASTPPLRGPDRPAARSVRAGAARADRRVRRRRARYNRAERDEAEERYGDYVDLVETGTEVARRPARQLRGDARRGRSRGVRGAFNQGVLKRFRASRSRSRRRCRRRSRTTP